MKRAKLIRKMLIPILVLLFGTLLNYQSFAQNAQPAARKITGKIVALRTGEPITGATVSVKGTKNQVETDEKGNFTINVRTGETVTISYIGYASKDIRINDATTSIGLQMAEDFGKMEDVVVIGYGKMKKTDLSSAQVTVTSTDIDRTVNTSLDQALQGRAANVYVTSNSGQPGAAASVVIRGISSLTQSTQPLYVVDGVQIRPDNPSDDPNNHPAGFANALGQINPDDIETMNILQGPEATSIYGAAGAAGVIMITTKRGKAGETRISISGTTTVQDLPKHIAVMNLQQYATYRNEIQKAGGTASEPDFADPSILGPGTDWQAALYRRTLLQKYSMALSGGTDKTTFYLSGDYFSQDGIAPGSGFNRGTIHLNLDNQTRKWLRIGTSLNTSLTNEKVNTTNAGIIQLAIQQNPSVPVKNPDGSWGGPTQTQYAFTNPVAIANINNDYNKALGVLGNIYADVTILKGLVFHTGFNGSYNYTNNYQFHPSYQFNNFINATTYSSRSANNYYWWSFDQRLQYDTKIGQHAITLMAGHEAQKYGNAGLTGSRQNFVTNDIQELSGGDQTTSIANSSRGAGSRESYFSRIGYIYNDKYILQGSFRADAYSNFGPANKWGYFPGVSAAWRISKEDFMKDVTAINDLKLRVEVGSSGNAGGNPYANLQAVPTAWGTGFLAQNFSNPNIHWEKDMTYNVGVDLHMLNNRIEVIADAYIKDIKDLITVNPYAYYNGGDIAYSPGYIQWPYTNVGSMKNHGVGVTINTVNIDKKNFVWKTGFNFSIDRNKITQLNTPIIATYNSSQASILSAVGQPASMITGYIAEGLFQNYQDIKNHAMEASSGVISPTQGTWVGDVKFKDISGPNGKPDGVIDNNDRTIIGNPWPKWTFGFNNYFTYKNFDLNIFITGSVGNDILNYARYQNEQPLGTGTYSNYYASVANFARASSYNLADSNTVKLTNPGYQISRIAPGDPNGNNRMSQWFVEDGSYIRLKNVMLGYNFPVKWISKAALKGLRLAVNVQNLVTITKYKGYDPEVGMIGYGGTMMTGIDVGKYPSVRMYTVNLIANF
ncbi:SusC/RagA family TonB-linked outer membrane protein [Chitinophagaceae bacterium LWZ2-11]